MASAGARRRARRARAVSRLRRGGARIVPACAAAVLALRRRTHRPAPMCIRARGWKAASPSSPARSSVRAPRSAAAPSSAPMRVIGPEVRIGRDCAIGAGAVDQQRADRRPRHHSSRLQDRPGRLRLRHGRRRAPARSRRSAASSSRTTSRSAPAPPIDRGAIRDTVIGEGTKIDNLVQVGHNVSIGRHCVLVAQVGISGSVDARRFRCAGRARRREQQRDDRRGRADRGDQHRPWRRARRARAGAARRPSRSSSGSAKWRCSRRLARAKAGADSGRRTSETVSWMKPVTKLEAADIAAVLKLLPHRYPFLMIDRVIDIRGDDIRHRHQERHHQRAAFPGTLSRQSGVPRRADDRGHGADRRRALHSAKLGSSAAEVGVFPDHRQGEIPQAGAARRHHRISHDAHRPAAQHVVVSAARPKSPASIVAEAEVGAMIADSMNAAHDRSLGADRGGGGDRARRVDRPLLHHRRRMSRSATAAG